jgi:outer membrane protein
MKRLLTLVVVLASGAVPMVQAQTPAATAAAQPTKIAVIAFQAAVAKTNEGQRDFADIEKKYEPKQQAIIGLKNQIDTLTKQLKADAPTLTEAQRTARARIIDDKTKQLDRSTQDARSDFTQDVSQAFNTLAAKVYQVMASYAKEKGYTVVLDISQQQSPVLYAGKSTDITNAVIAAYNAKSGVPAPAATTGGVPNAPMPAQKPTAAH